MRTAAAAPSTRTSAGAATGSPTDSATAIAIERPREARSGCTPMPGPPALISTTQSPADATRADRRRPGSVVFPVSVSVIVVVRVLHLDRHARTMADFLVDGQNVALRRNSI